jgi:hypothetical protein
MTSKQKADMFIRIKKATSAMFAKRKPPTKDQQIVAAARKIGGYSQEQLLNLLDLLVGKKLPRDGYFEGPLVPTKLACVVPGNTNRCSSYPVGEPCVVVSINAGYDGPQMTALRKNGATGNYLRAVNDLKPATDAQIREFLSALNGDGYSLLTAK